MEEGRYRESRLCRLFGNPVIYLITVFLAEHGPLTPSKLAEITGRSVQTVSGHLAKLRVADVVRYETEGKHVSYRLKHPREIREVLEALGKAVRASTSLG